MQQKFLQRGGLWVLGQSVLMGGMILGGLFWNGQWNVFPSVFCGAFFFCMAAVCGIAGAMALGRNLTPYPKPPAQGRLVQNGIYRLMRHPLYTAVFCGALGWTLVWRSLPCLTFLVLMGLLLNAKARREERWLRNQYPEYAQYEQRVRRFIPWLF